MSCRPSQFLTPLLLAHSQLSSSHIDSRHGGSPGLHHLAGGRDSQPSGNAFLRGHLTQEANSLSGKWGYIHYVTTLLDVRYSMCVLVTLCLQWVLDNTHLNFFPKVNYGNHALCSRTFEAGPDQFSEENFDPVSRSPLGRRNSLLCM
uniref:Uncharacterized protein n=1 Tax=Rousettus aegyptiacus TaxID=9407 RepID=A0A7J8E8J9_ROUAE|nr:hypothetical protein HJG63_008160 [Rousettus aegyptiacus]